MILTPALHTSVDAALPTGTGQGVPQMLMVLVAPPMPLAHAAQARPSTAPRTSLVINIAGGGALPTTTSLQAATHPTSLAEAIPILALCTPLRIFQETGSP